MPFFDDSKNRVGILTTRLASDAAMIHGVRNFVVYFLNPGIYAEEYIAFVFPPVY